MSRRVGWSIVAILVGVGAGLYLGRQPWTMVGDQRESAETARSERDHAQAERVRLATERARLESSIGREEMARRQGLRKPGEQPLEAR